MGKDNALRTQLDNVLQTYKNNQASDVKVIENITEKEKNFLLKLSQDQLKLLKRTLKDAKKYAKLSENLDEYIEYSSFEGVIYNQVIIQ